MYTLLLYIVTAGHMAVVRIPQDTLERCEANRPAFAQSLGATHAECKARKAAKAPKVST